MFVLNSNCYCCKTCCNPTNWYY